MSTFFAIWLVIISLISPMTREKFVTKLIDQYESKNGEITVQSCDFVDVEKDSPACKAFQIGITSGTSKTAFSPLEILKQYQAFLMIGKTLQLLSS